MRHLSIVPLQAESIPFPAGLRIEADQVVEISEVLLEEVVERASYLRKALIEAAGTVIADGDYDGFCLTRKTIEDIESSWAVDGRPVLVSLDFHVGDDGDLSLVGAGADLSDLFAESLAGFASHGGPNASPRAFARALIDHHGEGRIAVAAPERADAVAGARLLVAALEEAGSEVIQSTPTIAGEAARPCRALLQLWSWHAAALGILPGYPAHTQIQPCWTALIDSPAILVALHGICRGLPFVPEASLRPIEGGYQRHPLKVVPLSPNGPSVWIQRAPASSVPVILRAWVADSGVIGISAVRREDTRELHLGRLIPLRMEHNANSLH